MVAPAARKAIRGKNFGSALRWIAELRAAGERSCDDLLPANAPDEQRAIQFQIARIVLERGVRGLVEEWPVPADAYWRAELVSEITRWSEEAALDLLLAALEDADRQVRAKAVWTLLAVVREKGALDELRKGLTPLRRSRATRALVAMLEEHRRAPYPVLAQMVEVLGHTADPDDRAALEALEALRSRAGEPHKVSYEALDETKLDWRDRLLAERKGIAPDQVKGRFTYTPTGLLDVKLLEAALRRIRK